MKHNSFFNISIFLFFTIFLFLLLIIAPLTANDVGRTWTALDIPNPTKTNSGYVTSIGGYLTQEEIETINNIVLSIEKDTSVEIAVVIVPSMAEDIFTESQAIFDLWGIGKEGVDNGLLILAAIEDRDIRTHTGYGMEWLFTDALISVLQESIIVPAFKEGHYGEGLIAYISKIDSLIRNPDIAAELQAQMAGSKQKGRTSGQRFSNFGENTVSFFLFGGVGFLLLVGACFSLVIEIRAIFRNRRKKFKTYSSIQKLESKGIGKHGFFLPIFLFPFGAIFFFIGLTIDGFLHIGEIIFLGIIFPILGLISSLVGLGWSSSTCKKIIKQWRETPRVCPQCSGEMKRLSEIEDDEYLKTTQIKEENLDSVDYDVHVCSACGNKTIEKFRGRKYSMYTVCPTCKALACKQTKREVVKQPTYSSCGEELVHFECFACSVTYTKSSSIPKLTDSSSSSGGSGGGSSSSSSFGGGSSGGGGSTSSW